jgi:hypothetical protein
MPEAGCLVVLLMFSHAAAAAAAVEGARLTIPGQGRD